MTAYDYIATMMKRTKQRELKECNVVFRLAPSDLALVDEIAEHESLSRAQVLRRFVKKGLAEHDAPRQVA